MFKIIFSFAIACFRFASAEEILWIKINTVYNYQDVSTVCSSTFQGGQFFLAAEHDNGNLKRVVLNNFSYNDPYKSLFKSRMLSEEAVAKIQLYKDPEKRYWLKTFPVGEETIKWILFNSAEHSSYCPLPQAIKAVMPGRVTFEFETEGLEEGVLSSYSQRFSLEGTRADENIFKATLKMIQREYIP